MAIKSRVIMFLATGTYTGYFPLAPGTVGTLWGIVAAYGLSMLPLYAAIAVLLSAIALAIPISTQASRVLGKEDPGSVVCDEIVGFMVAAFMVPFTAINIILVFILFRIFDILKPPPVRLLERLPAGTGIVTDDVAAGIYANIAAQLAIIYLL